VDAGRTLYSEGKPTIGGSHVPGLVCAAKAGERFDNPSQLLDEMLAPLTCVRERVCTRTETPRCVLGVAAHDHDSGVASENGLTLAVYGEVCEPGLVEPGLSDAASLVPLCSTKGPSALMGLNGQYVAALWDDRAGELTIVTDPLGGARFHYWVNGDTFYGASQFKSFIWHPEFRTEVGEENLVEFLCLGANMEERSLFSDIRYLEGASMLTWRNGRVEITRYWEPTFQDVAPSGTVNDYAAEYWNILQRVAAKRRAHALNIALSSGYDSRLMAAAISETGLRDRAISHTMGSRPSYDVVFARRIAKQLGISHAMLPIPPAFFADYAVDGMRRTEGGAIGHTCWRLACDDHLLRNPGRVVLNGYWGDFFHGYQDIAAVEDQENAGEVFDYRFKHSAFWLIMAERELKNLLRPEIHKRTEGFVYKTMRRLFDTAPGERVRHKIDHFNVTCLWPRKNHRFLMDYVEDVSRIQFPYCDREVTEFAQRLPLSVRKDAKVPNAIFARYLPKVGAVPMAGTAMPIQAGRWTNLRYRGQGWLRYKGVPAMTFGAVQWRKPGAYVDYLGWLRTACRDFVESQLSDEQYLEDYFNMDNVRTIVGDVVQGRSDDYGKVYNLVTFVLFQKYYAEGRGRFR